MRKLTRRVCWEGVVQGGENARKASKSSYSYRNKKGGGKAGGRIPGSDNVRLLQGSPSVNTLLQEKNGKRS